MTDRFMIEIDFTEPYQEFQQEEPKAVTIDDLLNLVREGHSSMAVADFAVVQKVLTPEESEFAPLDLTLRLGAVNQLHRYIAKAKVPFETASGKTIQAREFYGQIGRPPGEEEPPVDFETEMDGDGEQPESKPPSYVTMESDPTAALNRCETYTLRVIPGHVYNHLVPLSSDETRLRRVIDELVEAIYDIRERLLAEPDNGGE